MCYYYCNLDNSGYGLFIGILSVTSYKNRICLLYSSGEKLKNVTKTECVRKRADLYFYKNKAGLFFICHKTPSRYTTGISSTALSSRFKEI